MTIKEGTFRDFYASFMEEVNFASDMETSGWEKDDFLTLVFLEYLEDIGEIVNPIICPFRGYGLQLNAYSFSDDFETLTICVSIYAETNEPQSITRSEVDASIKRAIMLFQKAINDLHNSFQKDNDTYEFAYTVYRNRNKIRNVRIYNLTNGLVKPMELKNLFIADTKISFVIWDIERLYHCVSSGKMREQIEIDFEAQYETKLQCIYNNTCERYGAFLVIMSGGLLAKMYEEYRDRLLEKNVRSYLQVRGAVNKGIRDTLRNEPEMFLAYNNGISMTAESIELQKDVGGTVWIKKIKDIQIVNGGQTTASLFNAKNDKKQPADLTNVFVPVKISVIASVEDMNEIVPRISAFANTQNKIQVADFSANDPFHREIENISRVVWTLPQGGQKPLNWFYERARGQYADKLAQESTSLKKRQFKETHPMFTKTDLAKYENTWDQMPYYVSEGAQKNFRRFMVRINEKKFFKPDEEYYKRLIAKAILFKHTEKLVHEQQFGGYRANIVTYTVSYVSYKTAQRIDLESIWKMQNLSLAIEETIIDVSKFIHKIITEPPGGANISEWCKKEKCWDIVKQYNYNLSQPLKEELLDVTKSTMIGPPSSASIESLSCEELEIIDKVAGINASTWFALSKWAKETNNFQPWQRSLLFSVGTIIGRGQSPTIKQAIQALKIHEESIKKGFTLSI